jgi:hypothetical protein
MFHWRQRERKLDVFFSTKEAQDARRELVVTPPPKNVDQNILEYLDCKKGTIFLS